MPKKLAIIMPSWVGDAVMATPAVRSLSNCPGSDTELIGVMQAPVASVLDGAPWFAQQLVYSKRKLLDRLALARNLRSLRPDAVVLLTNSWWTAAVAWLSGAKRRVGYARDGRDWMLTDKLEAPRAAGGRFSAIAAVDYYLALAYHMGCDTSDRRMELSVTNQDRQRADELLGQLAIRSDRPLIVINSSGLWGNAKIWPADHVEQLARRLVENHPWQVLLHCGPAEREVTDAIASRIQHPRVHSMGRAAQLPLGLSKAVLERAAVVVSTDSGPRHIAIALNKPVIGLYGPTDPAWTKTYNVPEIEVGLDLACRGCWQKRCPLKHNRCMRDLGVETVYAAIVAATIGQSRLVA